MDDLEKAYRDFEKLSLEHEPLASAGVMMAQAIKIYKAMLSEEEFNLMTQHVLNSVDDIEPLQTPTLQ
jgi:hypothetical protein